MKMILLLFICCILFLSACGAPSPVPTQARLDPTPSPPPGLTLEPPPAQPTAPDLLSTNAPTPVTWPDDFSPVLYGGKLYETTFFILLGGVSRDAWFTPDKSVARYAGEATYSLHSMTQEYKFFLWGKSTEFSPTCQAYTVSSDADPDEAGFVAVMDGWDVTKRPVTGLSADGEYYRQAVIDWLASEGVEEPQIGSLQIFRVDIEDDGTDEVFLSATRLDDSQHTTRAGDYSIVLMRKVYENFVITKFVAGDIYRSKEPEMTFPRTYFLANFIDLNQDGVLEVVVEFQKWEGFGAFVYQINGQDVIQTLGAGC